MMSTSFDIEQVYRIKVQQGTASHNNSSSTVLHSEPSFSIYNNTQNQDFEDDNELAKSRGLIERSDTIGDLSDALGNVEFTFGEEMGLIEETTIEDEEEEMEDEKPSLCTGDLKEYYRRILKEEPLNPLFLRNYAQYLQSQGDSSGAEEYYYRATLADPKEGEVLMQYAKLLWELHNDQDKASSYFERALSAASDDSNVQAAYARFLWEIDESEEEDAYISANTRTLIGTHDSVADDQQEPVSSPFHLAIGLGLVAPDIGDCLSSDNCVAKSSDDKLNIEDHYKRMIVENPRDPVYLRSYAEFLYQSKGDLAGALDYYSRATLVDPRDWETVSQYAKLLWKLHHDKDKATTYFELAVQASPENSDVLGDYARFLWEVEEDSEETPLGNEECRIKCEVSEQ